MAILAAAIALVCLSARSSPAWIAPHNPFDLTTLVLSDARLPPAWEPEGSTKYLLGTDDQGRDILSALIYGARISLVVGVASVLLSMLIGVGARPPGGLPRRLDRRLPDARCATSCCPFPPSWWRC